MNLEDLFRSIGTQAQDEDNLDPVTAADLEDAVSASNDVDSDEDLPVGITFVPTPGLASIALLDLAVSQRTGQIYVVIGGPA